MGSHQLTESNFLNRISTCDLLIQRNKREPFLKKLITGDESWILYDNTGRKRSWSSRVKCPPTVARPGLHPKKVLLSIWWDWKGILYYQVLAKGQTINSEKYCTQFEKLKEAIITKRLEMVKLLKFDWDVLPHPPYPPDLAPSSFTSFADLNFLLRRKYFRERNK